MTIATELVNQATVANWIDNKLSRRFQLDDRTGLALPCFDIALEHHSAICALAHEKHFASMYALLRVEFEACARGLWIRHAATDADLAKFRKDEMDIGMKALIDCIESRLGMTGSALSTIKTKHWDIFCSFTHTGYQALVRRTTESHTGSVNYPEDEVVTGLRFSGLVALLSAVELASLTGDGVLINEAMDRFRAY